VGQLITATSLRGRELRSIVSGDALPSLPSLLVGVGQSFSAIAQAEELRSSESSPAAFTDPRATLRFHASVPGFVLPRRGSPSRALGVGHSFAAIGSGIPAPLPLTPLAFKRSRLASHVAGSSPSCGSPAAGVGQEEEPGAALGSANVGRAETTPFRIEPQRGKVCEDLIKPALDERGDVLDEDERRRHLTHDASKMTPEARTSAGKSSSLPGVGDVLAREAASDEIHDATPRAAVEGGDIRPHRCRIQASFFHLRDQSGAGESFPLHVADDASAWSCQLDAAVEASTAGEEGEDVPGT